MYKKIVIALCFAFTLAACSSTQQVKKIPVTGVLSGSQEISLGTTKAPAMTGALFDTEGYTIIGVAYVLAARSTMNSQSAELSKLYADYVKDTSGVKPLKTVFIDEFNAELSKRNVKIKTVEVTPALDDKKAVTYDFDQTAIQSPKLLVIGGLTSIYHATGSTDSYQPKSSVLLSLVDPRVPKTTPTHSDVITATGLSESYKYSSYDDVKKDIPQSYEGLVRNTQTLARIAAIEVMGK